MKIEIRRRVKGELDHCTCGGMKMKRVVLYHSDCSPRGAR
jgi:hypothetical protein